MMILKMFLGITELLWMRNSCCESLFGIKQKSKWSIAAVIGTRNPMKEMNERLELMNPGGMQMVLSMQFWNHLIYHYDVLHCDNRLFSTDNSQSLISYNSPVKPNSIPQPFQSLKVSPKKELNLDTEIDNMPNDPTMNDFWKRVSDDGNKEKYLDNLYETEQDFLLIQCDVCGWPDLIHKDNQCTKSFVESNGKCSTKLYNEIITEIQIGLQNKRNDDMKTKKNDDSTATESDFKRFLDFMEKSSGRLQNQTPQTTKIVKMSKPPAWTKEMNIKSYETQVLRWNDKEKEISDTEKFHEVLESLKLNNNIKGLNKYVNDEITEICSNADEQNVENILRILKKRYDRSPLENIEKNWNDLKTMKVENGDDLQDSMRKMIKVTEDVKESIETGGRLDQFLATWMFNVLDEGKNLSQYERQELRNEMKTKDENLLKRFEDKFDTLKVEGKRSKDPIETNYINKES